MTQMALTSTSWREWFPHKRFKREVLDVPVFESGWSNGFRAIFES